jgi:hypothetical protein
MQNLAGHKYAAGFLIGAMLTMASPAFSQQAGTNSRK